MIHLSTINKNAYVWYVAYGSNLLNERFLLYISGGRNTTLNIEQAGCKDKALPLMALPWALNHPVYFSQSSVKWGGGGVAFLDDTVKGEALGKAYLITREQFKDLKKQEGNWYSKTLTLGYEKDIEVVTITAMRRLPSNPPSKPYLDVVCTGLYSTYPNFEKTALDDYLSTCIRR